MKTKKIILYSVILILISQASAFAFSSINAKVELIKATKNSKVVDPKLKDLIDEITPVLNYTGFTFIKKSEQELNTGQSSIVSMSTEKSLKLIFSGFEEEGARVRVEILEKNKKVFHTVLILVDDSFVLLGGPKYEDGMMLIRIGAVFR